MSQENVEVVERAIAAINARDIDAYLACCTENVELLINASVGAQYLGADGIRRFLTDIEDTGPDFRIEVQRVQAVGDSHAIAFVRSSWSGRVSGIATGVDQANVYDFTDGKITRVRIFVDRDEALKAVGLRSRRSPSGIAVLQPMAGKVERLGTPDVEAETSTAAGRHPERLAEVERLIAQPHLDVER